MVGGNEFHSLEVLFTASPFRRVSTLAGNAGIAGK